MSRCVLVQKNNVRMYLSRQKQLESFYNGMASQEKNDGYNHKDLFIKSTLVIERSIMIICMIGKSHHRKIVTNENLHEENLGLQLVAP